MAVLLAPSDGSSSPWLGAVAVARNPARHLDAPMHHLLCLGGCWMISEAAMARAAIWFALVAWLTSVGVVDPAQAHKSNGLYKLNEQVVELYQQGRHAEAVVIAKRALALAERLRGPDHADVVICLVNLTTLYAAQDRLAELGPLLERLLRIREKTLDADHPDVEQSLNNLAQFHSIQGRAAEAESYYRRSLAIREKTLGAQHPGVADNLDRLAMLSRTQGRYVDAEPLYRRALAIREGALGPEHADVATVLHSLATLYDVQGRYAEAEPLYRRALAIREKTLDPWHTDVALTLNNLALIDSAQGRYLEAEVHAKRSLAIYERTFGPDHADVGHGLNNLAALYTTQGRYVEAEPLFRRSLVIREKALGPDHPKVATTLNNLARLYVDQGRFSEAEPLFKRSLAISEKALGPEHAEVGGTLNNLAHLYELEGRYAEAEPLFKRTVSIFEKVLGPDHPNVGTSLNNLAGIYDSQGRYADAEPLYRRSLTNRERVLGPDHPSVGNGLNNLGRLYVIQGRYTEAEPLLRRAVSIFEQAMGANHRDVGASLRNLARLYQFQGRIAEAEPLHARALAILERALGPDHPDVGDSLNDRALLYFAQRDWEKAANYWRQSTELVIRRSKRGMERVGEALTGRRESEAARAVARFRGLVRVSHAIAEVNGGDQPAIARRMFQTAQWAQSSQAAQSLAQMAVRLAKGADGLAPLVRERQDLVAEWQAKDKLLIAARAEQPAHRNAEAEARLSQRLATIDARLAEIDATLKGRFPDYAALVNPEPLSVEEVQSQLRTDEALLLFLDTPETKAKPEETFIWVVTKTDMRWLRSGLGTPSLMREVTALRCGLDIAAWNGEGATKCADLLKKKIPDGVPIESGPLPFDIARAHELYLALFGQIADLVKDRHLLIVPSGPLTQLPFQVLVTERADGSFAGADAYRSAAWLARRHAIGVLPAVSSLTALRRDAKASRAAKPYLGIGNPLLDGLDSRYAALARQARQKQTCPKTHPKRVGGLSSTRGGMGQIVVRGGLVNVAHLRVQTPLPETADELCAVARDLKVGVEDVWLGARAREADLKALSEQGALANYRILHFATHGALSGEMSGGAEPGLVLNPPRTPTERDDGYLSASEIAGLRLDADWVILSACNTAAGNADNAEALSGLARSFFYAGARALLVSHWAVDSDATVWLVTKAISTIAADRSVGRAEALRRSMLALIESGQAHPAYWAPFVVVGEGIVN